MPTHDNTPDALNPEQSDAILRRDLLRLLAGSVLAISSGTATLLAGCGSGHGLNNSSNNSASDVATEPITGVVNTSEIGGAGLKVQNVYQSPLSVDLSGRFSALGSSQGANLMIVTDSAGSLRGMAIHIPIAVATETRKRKTRDSIASMSGIDAASTAAALVFLSPGILATDPSTAAARLESIQSLSSFQPLRDFLATTLNTVSLVDPTIAAQLELLKRACVTAWQIANVVSTAMTPGYGFSGSLNSKGTVSLENGGFRYVRVVRQLLDSSGNQLAGTSPTPLTFGNTLASIPIPLIDGAESIDISTILSQTVGEAGMATDNLAVQSVPGLATLSYWIYGPGFSTSTLTPPFSKQLFATDTNFSDAFITSLIAYVLVPTIDLIIGVGSRFAEIELIELIWSTISTSIAEVEAVQSFPKPTDTDTTFDLSKESANIVAWIKAVSQTFYTAAPSIVTQFASKFGIRETVVAAGFGILEFVDLALSAANLAVLGYTWSQYQPYVNVLVPVNTATPAPAPTSTPTPTAQPEPPGYIYGQDDSGSSFTVVVHFEKYGDFILTNDGGSHSQILGNVTAPVSYTVDQIKYENVIGSPRPSAILVYYLDNGESGAYEFGLSTPGSFTIGP